MHTTEVTREPKDGCPHHVDCVGVKACAGTTLSVTLPEPWRQQSMLFLPAKTICIQTHEGYLTVFPVPCMDASQTSRTQYQASLTDWECGYYMSHAHAIQIAGFSFSVTQLGICSLW